MVMALMSPYLCPLHDPMKRGTLRKLITDAGLSVEEFCELL